MSELFYNPYQFIPVDTRRAKALTTYKSPKDCEEGEAAGLDRSDNKFVRHDYWHKESLSGRIRCTLSTLSPLVVGAEQISGDSKHPTIPGRVTPYELKRHGYAIPGNSLRGMVGSVVEIISQSSMRVFSNAKIKDQRNDLASAFGASAGENVLPWGQGRAELTPAEAMFGVVEEATDKDVPTRNLASRIRFCDAIGKGNVTLKKAVTLKILNSPKLPSPAMYFSAIGGYYLSKERLDLNQHHPNGRKYYIPHAKGVQAWRHDETKDDPNKPRNHMRLSCTPIEEGNHFTFDIYFESLSVAELGLLQTALQPTGQATPFVHRLGLGKPYGLGHVSIDSAAVEIINRQTRYTLSRFMDGSTYHLYQEAPDLSLIDQDEALPALLALADKGSYQDFPVCYPYDQADKHSYIHQDQNNEDDGFKWFVTNDKKGRKDFLHRDKSAISNKTIGVMKPLASGKRRNTV